MVEATPLVGGTTMTDATEGLTAAAGPGFRFGGASVCCPRPSTVAPDAHPAELNALAAASNSAKDCASRWVQFSLLENRYTGLTRSAASQGGLHVWMAVDRIH